MSKDRHSNPAWAGPTGSIRHAAATCVALFVAVVGVGIRCVLAADSVVVFNEIMYHPRGNRPADEWVELHNQMAVDVDVSNWFIGGGIDYVFPEGTVIRGGGYLVIAASPEDLTSAVGMTNVVGPFSRRLANGGDDLRLFNNNSRVMDEVSYGVDGEWPVGPSGSGVSLSKRHVDRASGPARNWTVSAMAGGTPGRRNFSPTSVEVTTTNVVVLSSTWRFDASGADRGTAWRQTGFDDSEWASGEGPFQSGSVTPPFGDPEPVPTVFSSGVDEDGMVLGPGSPDPHYVLTQSAQGTPPPPPTAATVIQNHPAWAANDAQSSWIGPVNPGTENVADGNYNYRTTFTLDGFDASTASLTLRFGADNRMNDVLLNGAARQLSYVGFAALSSPMTIASGFVAGTNTLDFLTANDGPGANPAGFRVDMTGTARKQFVPRTTLPDGLTNYYLRTKFVCNGAPDLSAIKLDTVVADGAVFYLNGGEILRLNMPPGAPTASTLAVSNVPSPTYLGPFALPNIALVTGTNVLAVELHSAIGEDGVLFGASLSLTTTNILVPPPVALAFNESSSAANADCWVELINQGSTSVDLAGCVLECAGALGDREHVFPPWPIAPGSFVSVTLATLGLEVEPGDRLFLFSPGRRGLLDAVVLRRELRGRWPDGTGQWWVPTQATPDESNDFVFHDEVVINEIMYHAPGIPPVPAEYGEETLLPITARWRYNQSGANLGTSWVAPDFGDGAWPEGGALLYAETAPLPAPTQTPLKLGPTTFYFRTSFVFDGSTNGLELRLRTVLDDGAVFYINGQEVKRVNMPDGEVNFQTFASPGVTDATYLGPFDLVVTNLVVGTNVMAVEVHQGSAGSTDVVFGAELVATYQLSPGSPYQESSEAWVELFNRSSHDVDLSGWRLARDIDYAFPPGTTISPGGYLVVARDTGVMELTYPGLGVLGPFQGNLRRSGSHLLLLDATGNPVDEVEYFDGKPWPAYADGDGASLELRDPLADNAKPEAWDASVEMRRSHWTNVTYRAVAANTIGPTRWSEFIVGLLDAGECLIDDLSVVERPSGSPVQMLQNGTFETGLAAWRAMGNHNLSRVVVDPENPENHVLHLIATGPTEHMHNHLETTLAGGRSVVDGREYEVSFRAKWLGGNHRLNTRLYFNRVAKTTALPRPAQHGTPGAPNSALVPNIGPTFAAFGHDPVVPKAHEPVTVCVNASDPQGVGAVAVRWSANGGAWKSAPMLPGLSPSEQGYTDYSVVLPAQVAGTVVQFYVEAADLLGAIAAFPPGGTNSRALFKVDDGKPAMPALHRFRLLMTPADAAFLHASTNVMSNDRMGLTVVYDEEQVFYDVGVHLQGSERGRDNSSRVGFTVRLNSDQLFRGVQGNFVIDRSGGYSGRGGRHDEILLWHAVNHAGGVPGLCCDLVQVFAPRAQEDSTGLLRMSAFDADYFAGQFEDGDEGNRYTLELIYYPTTSVGNNAQAPKLPQPDDVINVDIQDRGENPENYRWIFVQENHADRDDYSQLIALNKAFSLTGSALEAQTGQLADVDEWMRALAFKAFTGDVDTFTYGLNHNWKIYFRPEDGRALGLLWDMDYSFAQSVNYASPGTGSSTTYNLTKLPNNNRRFCHHLFDMMTTTINTSYLAPWAAHYGKLVGQNWSGVVDYLQQRADYLRSTLPLATSFAITSNGGRDFSTTNSHVTLTGTAPITINDIELNGARVPVVWTSLTGWSLAASLFASTNVLVVRGLDGAGGRLSNAVDSITVFNLGTPAPRPVVINEWMADNAGPGGFADPVDGRFQDWFELYNPNSVAVNLSGYCLTDDLSQPAKWRIPTDIVIAPRGFLLVWADSETNQNGLFAGGDLHADFQLSNGGEDIGLFSPNGAPQHAVTFDRQIENVSQGLFPDGDTNAFHSMPNWTPRASNRLYEPPTPQVGGVTTMSDGTVSFTVSSTLGRTYRVEYKDDLNALEWMALGDNRTALEPRFTVVDTLSLAGQRFYRVVLLQ